VAVEELEDGFAALAAPVFRPDGQAAAAVSIGGPSDRLGPERRRRLAGLLQRHAAKVSRNLGYLPERTG
jgi:IclR family acetate operon transcriptional repressor